jgi:hypothetical protein
MQEVKMYKLTTRWFARWAKKEHISDEMLKKSINDLGDKLSTVSLGSGLYKVRMASCGSGKSSSYRTIVIFRKDDRVLMVYGFAKSKQDNLSKEDLKKFKALARDFLSLLEDDIELLIQENEYFYIGDNNER